MANSSLGNFAGKFVNYTLGTFAIHGINTVLATTVGFLITPAYKTVFFSYISFAVVVAAIDLIVILGLVLTQLKRRIRKSRLSFILWLLILSLTSVSFYSYFYTQAYTFQFDDTIIVKGTNLTEKAARHIQATIKIEDPVFLLKSYGDPDRVWENISKVREQIQLQIALMIILYSTTSFYALKLYLDQRTKPKIITSDAKGLGANI